MNKLFRMKVYGSTEQQIDDFLARVYQVVEELRDSDAGKSVGLLIHEVVPMRAERDALIARVEELAGPLGRERVTNHALRARVADLSMLVKRLSRFAPPKPASEAIEYLKRHQLEGSPLRDDPSAGAANTEVSK